MVQTDFDARASTWDDDPKKRARAASVAAALRKRIDLSRRPRALEYGAGTGLLTFEIEGDLADAVLADSSAGMLAVADRKIAAGGLTHLSTLAIDLMTDPPPAQRFDLIYSMMTLHHVPDTAAILRIFHDLLTPGGAIAIADLDAEDGSFHGPDVDVHHGFDRTALGRLIEAAGFHDVVFDTCFEMRRGDTVYPVFLVTARA